MGRKSGIGRNSDDFDFNKSKPKPPPKLSQIRENSKTSFYLKPDPTIFPEDPCGNLHIGDIPDLNIIGKPGRQFGETVLYDPVQRVNYLSISDRYERSLNLLPVKISEEGNTTTYYFCSDLSPSGFWEVVIGGGGTYINFTNPILTIICPRPFRLQDYTGVETDGTSVKWTQTQGRITIVSPASGEGSLNPFISIIGNRTPLDPPILLLAELEDNPAAFDFLVIRTTITEVVDGVSGNEGAIAPNAGPVYKIPCLFSPLPDTPNTAYCWVSGSIEITWNPPSDYLWISEYQLQENIGGTYQTIQTIPGNAERRATVELGKYYRILTINNVLGRGYAVTESCRIFFNAGDFVFGSDRLDGLAGSDGRLTAVQYPIAVIRCETPIDEFNGLAGGDGRLSAVQYPIAAIRCETPVDEFNGLAGSDGKLTAVVYNLVGGIVG